MDTHQPQSTSKNRMILTIICYLCYFFTATVIVIIGPLLTPIAKYFHNNNIGFAFTYVNVSMWFAFLVAGTLMRRFSIKSLLIIAIVICLLAAVISDISPSLATFKILMAAIGFSGGIFMAIGSYMIVHLYNDHKIRAMHVIFSDSFFSFGGVVIPILAAYLITANFSWYAIYSLLQITVVIILVLIFLSDFSIFSGIKLKTSDNKVSLKSWNFSLYCIAFSAFFFILGELILTGFAPTYFSKVLGWGTIQANQPLTYFWIAQCVGLLVSPLITKRVPLKFILPVFMTIAVIALGFLIYSPNTDSIIKAAIIFGIFNCYIYAAILAYGTFQLSNPPPTLITTILLFGTTGTALSTATGSYIYKHINITAVMHSVLLFYVICLVLIVLAVIFSKENKYENKANLGR